MIRITFLHQKICGTPGSNPRRYPYTCPGCRKDWETYPQARDCCGLYSLSHWLEQTRALRQSDERYIKTLWRKATRHVVVVLEAYHEPNPDFSFEDGEMARLEVEVGLLFCFQARAAVYYHDLYTAGLRLVHEQWEGNCLIKRGLDWHVHTRDAKDMLHAACAAARDSLREYDKERRLLDCIRFEVLDAMQAGYYLRPFEQQAEDFFDLQVGLSGDWWKDY